MEKWVNPTRKSTPNTKKVAFAPSQNFLNEWVFISETGLFIHKDFPEIRHTQQTLNGVMTRFSDQKNVADMLMKGRNIEVQKLCYRPETKSALVSNGVTQGFNLFTPSLVQSVSADVSPFLEFIRYLIPDEREAHEVLRWCATLIGRLDVRMGYALLLISETQGTGKTTLADQILRPLVGDQNVSSPSDTAITDSFNAWAGFVRLVIVSEVYQGDSWKTYNTLKGHITDEYVTINEKFKPPITVENRMHVFASSNSMKALRMEESDRRWYVPKCVEKPWTQSQFADFRKWLRAGGLGAIKYWAENFDDYVKPGQTAPRSGLKNEMIIASDSAHIREASLMVSGYLDTNEPYAFRVSKLVSEARREIRQTCYDDDTKFRKSLQRQGWEAHSERVSFDGRKDWILYNKAMADVLIGQTLTEQRKLLRNFVFNNQNVDNMQM